MQRCNKPCSICPFILPCKEVNSQEFKWKIRSKVNCNTSNVIYMIQCNKQNCNIRYIGETQNELRIRITQHRSDIINDTISKPVGQHFNENGHNIDNLSVTI